MKKWLCMMMAAVSVVVMMATMEAKAANPAFNSLQVNYIYYNTSGGYTVYREEDFDDFSTASIGLFQIAVDDMAQRSDGYLYECNTKVWLDGVTENNSVSISFGNPCSFNGGVSDATMQNPYNMLSIAMYLSDGSTVYFDGVGGKNDLGNVSAVELAGFGTCEMSNEIVITLIQGVAIDRVDIRVSFFADQKNPPYRPITWWGNGVLEFGEINTVERALEEIKSDVNQITVSQATIIQQNETLIDEIEKGFDKVGSDIESAASDIADAISGEGAGENIGTAQEKLDQQLQEIENVENQIADQVADKIEIPSLVLNDSQLSSLQWVIGMINSWYLKFDELQVLFSSLLFFGIIGVVLFGRRSL